MSPENHLKITKIIIVEIIVENIVKDTSTNIESGRF